MKEEFVDLFSNSHDQFCMKKKSLIHEEGHQDVRVPAIFDKIW